MTKQYDKIFKENIEAMYLSLSEKVLNFRPLKVEDVKLELHRTIERLPDFLTKVRAPETSKNFLLHIEIQKLDDREMLHRMLEYFALIVRKYKMSLVQIVIYVGKGKSKMNNYFEDGENRFTYHLLSIQNISYRTFLDSDKPEELLLTILANLENESAEAIIEKVLHKAKYVTNETFSLDKFVSQFEVLAKMRNFSEPFKIILDKIMPIEIKIEDTYIFKKGKELGEKNAEKIAEKIAEKRERRGEIKKRNKMILALYKKGKLSIEDIAEVSEVTVDYVKKLLAKSGN
jgi:hypothetical protein